MTECRARSASLWVHRKLFWQLSRDGNVHGSGMSQATTASPQPPFRAPWRVGDALVGRENAGWRISERTSLHMPELLARASCRKDRKKIFAESSLIFPDGPVGHGAELN